jgi:hypothetical protein
MHSSRIASGIVPAAGSVIVSLTLCEVVTRWRIPQIAWRPYRDINLGWSTREYQQFDPVAQPRVAGQKRLLFVGDSYLAGSGIRQLDRRFPILLAQRFSPRVAVQILATAGWGTDQELLAFLQKGVRWQPDTIVVAFCANNDLADILSNGTGGEYKPYFVVDEQDQLTLFTGRGAPISVDSALTPQPWPFGVQSHLLDLTRMPFATSGPAPPASTRCSRESTRAIRSASPQGSPASGTAAAG